MVGTLVIERDHAKGREVPLRSRKVLMGHGHNCDVQILDESLSRVHCIFEKNDESVVDVFVAEHEKICDGNGMDD